MKTIRLLAAIMMIAIACQQPKKAELLIPDSMPKFDVLINDYAFDGYIFLREIYDPGAQFMIDQAGKIIWYQLSDSSILRAFTPYEKSYLAMLSKKEIHEITYYGDTLLRLRFGEGGFDRELHHEIIKDGDGNILSLTHEILPMDLSEIGGNEIDTVKTHGIIKLSREGKKLWSWSLNQVENPMEYPDILKAKSDWGHANSLAIDEDGNYLISWRDFDQVWKIDSKTGQIMWKYGDETIVNESDRFYHQHAFHRNQFGNYVLLDNGLPKVRQSSRALIFTRENGSFENINTITFPDSLFTFREGSVYQFEKDRFLFSSSLNNSIIITNDKGEVLWFAKSRRGFYRAYYVPKTVLN